MTDKGPKMAAGGAKPPILLTKAEALTWAAGMLDSFASSMSLTKIIIDAVDQSNAPGAPRNDSETKTKLDELRRDCPEPALQVAAAQAAAKAIRDMVLEERLVAARVEAGAGIRP